MKTTVRSRWLCASLFLVAAPFLGSLATLSAQDPNGEYGDAPDNSATYYPKMFPTSSANALFPTHYATANSRIAQKGVHHLNPGLEWFGKQPSTTSAENGASDPADPDGWSNLVNDDGWDDGLPQVPFFIVLTSLPPPATLSFDVSVAAGATAGPRYVNVLIDWDQDGRWQDLPAPALPEWVVKNMVVNVAPGTTSRLSSPAFAWGWNALLAPQIFWVRMTLTDLPIGPAPYNYLDTNGCWDGSGVFNFGETEDYLFHPDVPLKTPPGTQWNPPGTGGGPGGPWVTLDIKPQDQTIAHTAIAFVDIFKIPPGFVNPAGPPVVKRWAILPTVGLGGQGGSDPGGDGWLEPGDGVGWDSFTMPASGTQVGLWGPPIPGGPAGTVFTITVDPIEHRLFPPTTTVPVNVRVKWPGILSTTLKAVVHVIHSGRGIFGMFGCFCHLEDIIWDSPLDPLTKTTMTQLAREARASFETGDYTTATSRLDDIDVEANNHEAEFRSKKRDFAYPPESFFDVFTEITQTTGTLRERMAEINGTTGPIPAPAFTSPRGRDWAHGSVPLDARCHFPGVSHVCFQRWDPTGGGGGGGGAWVTIAEEELLDGHASTALDTTTLPDETLTLRVYASQGAPPLDPDNGYDMLDQLIIDVDNTPPEFYPIVLTPQKPEMAESGDFDVAGIPEDFTGTCSLQLRAMGGSDWFTVGQSHYFGDPDDGLPPEPVTVTAHVANLGGGVYEARVVLSDEADNDCDYPPMAVVSVHPCYGAWKMERGMSEWGDETDNDCDGRKLIFEYYSNTDPTVCDSPAPGSLGITVEPGAGTGWLSTHHPVPRGGITGLFGTKADLTDPDWIPLAGGEIDMQKLDNELEVPLGDRGFFNLLLSEP